MKRSESAGLAQKKCLPCEGGAAPLPEKNALRHLKSLPLWKLAEDKKSIFAEYEMKNFMAAVGLIQKIAGVAELENHHPDLHLTSYRKLRVELSTHSIGGLSENDFIVAAKIEGLPKELRV